MRKKPIDIIEEQIEKQAKQDAAQLHPQIMEQLFNLRSNEVTFMINQTSEGWRIASNGETRLKLVMPSPMELTKNHPLPVESWNDFRAAISQYVRDQVIDHFVQIRTQHILTAITAKPAKA